MQVQTVDPHLYPTIEGEMERDRSSALPGDISGSGELAAHASRVCGHANGFGVMNGMLTDSVCVRRARE